MQNKKYYDFNKEKQLSIWETGQNRIINTYALRESDGETKPKQNTTK